eukprot:252481-Pleurochrysis_carterae.AAC.1
MHTPAHSPVSQQPRVLGLQDAYEAAHAWQIALGAYLLYFFIRNYSRWRARSPFGTQVSLCATLRLLLHLQWNLPYISTALAPFLLHCVFTASAMRLPGIFKAFLWHLA